MEKLADAIRGIKNGYAAAVRALGAAVVWFVFLVGEGTALAEVMPDPQTRYRIGLTVDVEEGVLLGEEEISFTNASRVPLGEVVLRLLPNHFREMQPGVGEVNFSWVYPGDFDPAWLSIEDIRHDGRPVPRTRWLTERGGRVVRVALPTPVSPGERAVLRLRYRCIVPERFGRFGLAEGYLTLAGGAYPELAALAYDGFREEDPPTPARFRVALTVPARMDVIAAGRLFPTSTAGGDGEWRRVDVDVEAPYLVLVVAPHLAASTRRFPGGGAVVLGPSHEALRDASPRAMSTAAIPEDLPDVPRTKLVLDALAEAGRFWRARGLTLPGDRRIVAAVVPLRMRIASEAPGLVLVSDRAFELPPFRRTWRFHSVQVMRAAFAEWARLVLAPREHPSDLPWVADFVASALVEAWIDERAGGREWAGSILGPFAFHPVVDQLLYAPTVQFGDAYFPFVEEPDPLREEPERFLNDLPRGRRIHAKLGDLLGRHRFAALLGRYLATGSDGPSLRDAATTAAGEDLDWFFRQWLGPYPSVAYRLGRIRTEDRRGAHVHRVEVVRMGEPVREPVVVRVETDAGEVVRETWSGEGERGDVTMETRGERARVVVDPAFNLVEDPSLAENHPRFDNLDPVPWRPPVFNSFRLDYSVSETESAFAVDFGMRRQYDLTHAFGLRAEATSRGYGSSVRYLRGFGHQRDTNARTWYAGPIVGGTRWSAGFDDRSEAATSGSLSFLVGRDTRLYRYDPWTGTSLALAGGGSATVPDRTGEAQFAGSLAVRTGQVFTPVPRHTFALFQGAGVGLGRLLPAQLQALGGRQILRAYELDEAIGRSAVYALGEYRYTAAAGLDGGFVHLVWLRALQPVLFVGAGTVGGPNELFQKKTTYLEAGGGLRLHIDYGGVQQGIVALDVGVPLSRTMHWVPRCVTVENDETRCYADLGVVLSFDQTF